MSSLLALTVGHNVRCSQLMGMFMVLAAGGVATAGLGCDDGPGLGRKVVCGVDANAASDGAPCVPDAGEDEPESLAGEGGQDARLASDDSTDDAAGDPIDADTCDPSADPQGAPCALSDAYGIFVAASGADDASGTAAAPLRTIAEGLAQALLAGKRRVFVCQGRYPESVTLGGARGDISLYGGFDCIGGWRWTGAAAEIAAPTSLPALRIDDGIDPITVEDLSLTATDAVGQDSEGRGRSAVAAAVNASTVIFRRVTFFAGKGADGAPGRSGGVLPNYRVDQPAAPPGIAFSYSPFVLGAGGVGACVYDAAGSQGGVGGAPGDRSTFAGYPGGAGAASPTPSLASLSSFYNGAGGTPSANCQPPSGSGNPGANGLPAPSGAMASSYGLLFEAVWLPSAGQFGGDGNPGQGGGGGAGQAFGPSSAIFGGAGGGAGGCGGTGGGGGQGGGASFALVSTQSTVTLFSCTLIASDGGQGGPGGAGQSGQPGGLGGAAGACSGAGGAGGNGAGGSGGGGGTGGLSVGIAYQSTLPIYDTHTTIVFGAPGSEGVGGPPGPHAVTPGQIGLDGVPGAFGRGGLAAAVASL